MIYTVRSALIKYLRIIGLLTGFTKGKAILRAQLEVTPCKTKKSKEAEKRPIIAAEIWFKTVLQSDSVSILSKSYLFNASGSFDVNKSNLVENLTRLSV